MEKQKIPITALSMPENVLGIESKQLKDRMIVVNNTKTI